MSDRTIDACGIHVRRGDYLSVPHVLPVQPIEYYRAAVDHAVRQWGTERFIVDTDDPDWVSAQFLPRFPSSRIDIAHAADDIHDFIGLTECRWLITANSTFSVWPESLQITVNA